MKNVATYQFNSLLLIYAIFYLLFKWIKHKSDNQTYKMHLDHFLTLIDFDTNLVVLTPMTILTTANSISTSMHLHITIIVNFEKLPTMNLLLQIKELLPLSFTMRSN